MSNGEKAQAPTNTSESDRRLRVMTLNMAHGRSLATFQGFVSTRRTYLNLMAIAGLIEREQPDVVALQEADGPSSWSGNFDHVAYLAQQADFPHVFRGRHARDVGPIKLDYGTALLARQDLEHRQSERFESNWRDNKGFVVASMPGPTPQLPLLDLVSVHLDFLKPRIRSLQVAKMVQVLAERGRPLVIMGDFNCSFKEVSCVRRLVEALDLRAFQPFTRLPTFPADKPRWRLDWILVSPELDIVDYEVLEDVVSDHTAILAELRASADAAPKPDAQPAPHLSHRPKPAHQ